MAAVLLLGLLALLTAEYSPARKIAEVQDPGVRESSGLAVSAANSGSFWTHNDSGDGPFLYSFDSKGSSHGRWRVLGALADDWEDLAAGPCTKSGGSCLFIGDIGDNSRDRSSIVVYRVEEPGGSKGGSKVGTTRTAVALRFRYPDGPHNAETLLVHPTSGSLYIVTKAHFGDSETLVFRGSALGPAGLRTLQRVASLNLPDQSDIALAVGRITGGAISPDGRSIALCDYFRAYEARLPAGKPFDAIWKQPFVSIPFTGRTQGEAITYSRDGQALLGTSEGKPCPLFEMKRLH